jgi:hypothetical protein
MKLVNFFIEKTAFYGLDRGPEPEPVLVFSVSNPPPPPALHFGDSFPSPFRM